MSQLSGNENIKVAYEQWTPRWDPIIAQSNAENALSANNDSIAAFIAMNDGMANGISQAISARGLQGKIYVSGLDGDTSALKLIHDGVQSMTVFGDIEAGGAAAVRAAVALAKKEKPEFDKMVDLGAGEVPTYYMPITAVTKDNLCEFLKGAPEGWTSVEEVFGDSGECK